MTNAPTPDDAAARPRPRGLKPVLKRNISALTERRTRQEHAATRQDKAADAITLFVGSLPFIYLHAALVAAWVAVNLRWLPVVPAFDRSFVVLATAASVEAIFLSTFVLISQNRANAAADRRADLDLQIGLLSEHEVSKLIELVTAVARRVGVEPHEIDDELKELSQDVRPETVLDDLDAKAAETRAG